MAIFKLGKQFPLTDPKNALMDSGLDSTQRALIGREILPEGNSVQDIQPLPKLHDPSFSPPFHFKGI